MDAFTPDMDRPETTSGGSAAGKHTEELTKLIGMLGRASNLMGRARNVVDMGQHALPQVREKLHSISNANEEAAMSIMNETETISQLSDHIQRQLVDVRSAIGSLNAIVAEAQSSEHYSADDRIKVYVDALLQAVCAHELSFVQSLNGIVDAVEQVRRSAMTISMTLQVQDITAQQLAGAGQMVDHVQTNLTTMFSPHAPENVSEQPKQNEAFNPDAKFDQTENRQSLVDDLFNQIHKNMEG